MDLNSFAMMRTLPELGHIGLFLLVERLSTIAIQLHDV